MAINLHLKNLSPLATNLDIRRFFDGFTVPAGGVQIIGGRDGEAFITFAAPDDLLRALTLDQQPLLGQPVKLLLAKRDEMDRVIGMLAQNLGAGQTENNPGDPERVLDMPKSSGIYSHTRSAVYSDDLRPAVHMHSPTPSYRLHGSYKDVAPLYAANIDHSQDYMKDVDTEKTTDLAIRSRQYEVNLRARLEKASHTQVYSNRPDIFPHSMTAESYSYSKRYTNDEHLAPKVSENYTQCVYTDLGVPRITSTVTTREYEHDVKRRRMDKASDYQYSPTDRRYSPVDYKGINYHSVMERVQMSDGGRKRKVPISYLAQSLMPDTSTPAGNASPQPGFVQACNIPLTATARDLREFFSGHNIADNGIIMKMNDRKPDTLNVFVKFVNMKDAIKADCICDGFRLHGNKITVGLISQFVFENQRTVEQPKQGLSTNQQYPPPIQTNPFEYQHVRPLMSISKPPLQSSPSTWKIKSNANAQFARRKVDQQNTPATRLPKRLSLLHPDTIEDLIFLKWVSPKADIAGANKIWSLFGGKRGPSSGVIVVYNRSGDLLMALIAYAEREARNNTKLNKERRYRGNMYTKASGPAMLRLLGKQLQDQCQLYVSTETGVDRMITAQEKAWLMPQGKGKPIQHEVEQKVRHLHQEFENAPPTNKAKVVDSYDQHEQKMPNSPNCGDKKSNTTIPIDQSKVTDQAKINSIGENSNAVKASDHDELNHNQPISSDGEKGNKKVLTGSQEVKGQVSTESGGHNSNETTSSNLEETSDQKPSNSQRQSDQITASRQNEMKVQVPSSSGVQIGNCSTATLQGEHGQQESVKSNSQKGYEVTSSGQDDVNDHTSTSSNGKEGNDSTNNATISGKLNKVPSTSDNQNKNENKASGINQLNDQVPTSNDGQKANNCVVSGEYESKNQKPTRSDGKNVNAAITSDQDEPNKQELTSSEGHKDQIAISDQEQVMDKEPPDCAVQNASLATATVQCGEFGAPKEQMATVSEQDDPNEWEPNRNNKAGEEYKCDPQSETNSTGLKSNKVHNEINESKASSLFQLPQLDTPYGIFDPDIIANTSYIKVFKPEIAFPGVKSATALWDVFGGATGRCQGVITYTPKKKYGEVSDAVLAYMSETQRDNAFRTAVTADNSRKRDFMSKSSGARVLQFLSVIASSKDQIHVSSKSGRDGNITSKERHILQKAKKDKGDGFASRSHTKDQKRDLERRPKDRKTDTSFPEKRLKQKADTSVPERRPKQKADTSVPERRPKQKADTSVPERRPKQKADTSVPERRPKQKADISVPERKPKQKADTSVPERSRKQKADTNVSHKQKWQKEDSSCLFDPDVIKNLSFIRINRPTPGKCATDLWVLCGYSNGKCLGVITVQDIFGNTIIAFLAYTTADDRNIVIDGQKNIEGKWSKCSGPAVMRYLAYFWHKDHQLFVSTKDLEDQEITSREGRKMEAAKDKMSENTSVPERRCSVERTNIAGVSTGKRHKGLYTYIRFGELQPKMTACEIWSWFKGKRGPSPGVTMVRDENGNALLAYVCIKETHVRSIKHFTKSHYTTATYAERRRELTNLDSTYGVFESTSLGKDKVIPLKMLSGEEDLLIAEIIDVPEVDIVRSAKCGGEKSPVDVYTVPSANVDCGLNIENVSGDFDVISLSPDEDSVLDEDYVVVDEFVADSDIEVLLEDQSPSVGVEIVSAVDSASVQDRSATRAKDIPEGETGNTPSIAVESLTMDATSPSSEIRTMFDNKIVDEFVSDSDVEILTQDQSSSVDVKTVSGIDCAPEMDQISVVRDKVIPEGEDRDTHSIAAKSFAIEGISSSSEIQTKLDHNTIDKFVADSDIEVLLEGQTSSPEVKTLSTVDCAFQIDQTSATKGKVTPEGKDGDIPSILGVISLSGDEEAVDDIAPCTGI